MKHFLKNKGKRITALVLTLVMCLVALPMSAFAWTSEEGKTCTSYFGEKYVGSDGEHYYSQPTTTSLFYNEDGSTYTYSYASGNAKTKYYMQDSTGTHQVYCIESGMDFRTGDDYVSANGENSRYFQNLPSTAQLGIMVTLLYGWHEGLSSPVPGTNVDDYAFATQTLLWEYQQQLRTSPTQKSAANGISADMFSWSLAGRPAEKCYNWILEQSAQHYTVPSFASNQKNSAQTYTLKYDQANENYSLTLTDTNNVLKDIRFSSSSGITVTRNGNKYTFTSKKMIENAVGITAQKVIPNSLDNMLIWGCPGKQTMTSGAEDPVFFYLNIKTETTGVGHIVKHSEDGKVGGIRFTITGNGVNKTVTTKADGTVDIELMPGVYTVTEEIIDKYEPQNTQRVTIVSGGTSTVTFSNVLKRGNLTVTKTSEDGLNEGVKFHLFGTSLSGLAVDEYAVTDSSGKAYFRDVLIGTGYTLEEIDTAIRYVVPENQTAAVEWNKVTNKSFTNILKKWNVTVTKSDSETGTPQGDASLAGAVYGIYKGEQLIDTYTTDANGQFTTKFYVCGDDWSVREITPSEGYLLDESAHHIGAEAKNYTVEYNSTANDVTEQIIKGNIALIKHTDDGSTQLETPEVGAEFEVFLKTAGSYAAAKYTERDYLVCDENGFAETKMLPYGIYTVHQVKGWDGRELLPDFDVYIAKDGQTYRYLANNGNFESYIKIVKVDAETGKVIPYAGAGFQLYRPDGSLITQTFTYPSPTTIDTFYTNDEGTLITPEKLEYGSGYSLIEVFAPYGYTLNSDPVYFDVVQEDSTDDGGVAVIEVVKENIAQKGVIKISKSGEVFSSVTAVGGGIIDENGNDIAFPNMYQPVFSVQGLPGAVYEITAAEDIITPDGTLRASAGEVVDIVTTDETGLAESKALYLGKYEIRESKAPYGMVLNTEIRTAELVYAGQEIEIIETSASFYNERQKAAVSLDKVLEQNAKFGIGMNDEMSAVTFGMFATEDLTAADGSVIPADGLLEILSVDENGHADCKPDLPFGSFYLKELSTDEHYILSGDKHPIVFEYAGQETALVEIKANDGAAIGNDLIYGEIHGLKKDEDGNGLGGAVIGLFKADCTEFTTENALMTATSAEDGSFSFTDVPYGNWVVREIEAPTAFVLSEETFAVTVNEDGAVIEVEIENTLIRGTVQLTKVDKDYPDNKLTGAEFAVYRDSNGNKELDADDELLGTLTETGIGVYEMPDLIYGGFFVKEQKAPSGFYLDENAYYFEITEHGKTVIVENEAGKGFVNAAQVGSLKIIKTSSDNKVEGFSFHVTGPNGYSEVFTTDKNGEILIENLRIGEYVISEVSDGASAAYILPADKTATVFEGAVTKVEMHNELRDTPKTGDDSNPALWKWLTAIGVLGFAACGGGYIAYAMKKRRKDGAEY